MSLSRLFKTVLFIASFGLAACVSTPMPIHHAAPDYAALPPVRLDLAEIIVVNDGSTAPLTAELASKYGPASPEAALREWAARRIQPVGPQGSFSIIIKDANFAATKLPQKTGFTSYFERQQVARWDAYLSVVIAVDGSIQGLPPADISINVRTSQTIGDKPSDEEKRQTYESILNHLMTLFDKEATRRMDEYFRAYYVY